MVRWMMALALGAVATTTASATDGLEWDWEGATHRYLLRTDVQLAEVIWIRSNVSRESRIVGFAVDIVTTCVGGDAQGKRGWEVTCIMDDLSVVFDEAPSEPGVMDGLAKELDALYTGKPVVLAFNRDGRLRSFEVEGIDETDRRNNQIHQPFREMLRRAFAPLEVRLPRKGTDRGSNTWKHIGSMAMQFPSILGSIGRADITYAVTSQEGAVVSLDSTAEGVMGTGEMVTINNVDRPRNQYNMELTGNLQFNIADGYLVKQSYVTSAVSTASATLGEGGNAGYRQRSEALWIAADTRVNLGESGERGPSLEAAE